MEWFWRQFLSTNLIIDINHVSQLMITITVWLVLRYAKRGIVRKLFWSIFLKFRIWIYRLNHTTKRPRLVKIWTFYIISIWKFPLNFDQTSTFLVILNILFLRRALIIDFFLIFSTFLTCKNWWKLDRLSYLRNFPINFLSLLLFANFWQMNNRIDCVWGLFNKISTSFWRLFFKESWFIFGSVCRIVFHRWN